VYKNFAMQARRTIEHGADGGWSSVAVHLAPAGATKEGFYLTLFPDGRAPVTLFLRPQQLQQLVEMAGQATVTDQQIWEFVAKIPMEPLAPSRSLYPRLRALLVDSAGAIQAQIRAQADRPRPPAPPVDADEEPRSLVIEAEPEGGSDVPDGGGSGIG
jgi:hypothetical protein